MDRGVAKQDLNEVDLRGNLATPRSMRDGMPDAKLYQHRTALDFKSKERKRNQNPVEVGSPARSLVRIRSWIISWNNIFLSHQTSQK